MLNDKSKTALTNEYFLEIVNVINSATTIKELFENVNTGLGVKVASYHHFAAVGSIDFKNLNRYHAYNMPQEILDFYDKDTNHRDDPGVFATFAKGEFIWLSDFEQNPHVIKKGHNKLSLHALSVVGDGLAIPLFGPKNRCGYAFIGFGRDKKEFDPIMPYQVQALIQKLHVHYCLMVLALQKQVNLTPRESEVLELISFGKSNPDIAQILNISPNTVTGYVHRIFIKLDVADRVSAAMRAQSLILNV